MSVPVIVGAAALPVRRNLVRSVKDSASEVALAAIADAGLAKDDIDGLYLSPPGLSGPPGFMFSCSFAHHLGLTTRAQAMVECGGMSSALTLRLAVEAIRLGRCRACLVMGIDVRLEPQLDDLEHYLKNVTQSLIGLYGPHDGVYGLGAPIPYYAMSAQRYLHEYGASERDFAELAVLLRSFAVSNPRAEHRRPLSIDEALGSRPVCPPLKLADCSTFASGVAALIVAEEGLSTNGKRAIAVSGIGEHHEPTHFASLRGSLTHFPSASRAARAAFAEAHRSPNDVDVAEIYGVFSATELILYEDLGFFEKGRAHKAVRDGLTRGEGRTVLSASGGRLGLGHPAGATPLYAAVELCEQLRGEARGQQVPGADVALLHAEHGMLNGSIVYVFEGQ